MSRIGQSPVSIKDNVEAILENKSLKIKGPKGFLEMEVSNSVDLKINDDNIFGFQFHPEKSGSSGLKILYNWLKLR